MENNFLSINLIKNGLYLKALFQNVITNFLNML
jgi:hypothetical protein